MKPLSTIFLFALCLSVRAQTLPLPSGVFQSATVQKQAMIQMQSAAASIVDTNEYWTLPTFGWSFSGTNQTGFLFCGGSTKFVPVVSIPLPATARTASFTLTNSPLASGVSYWWVMATNAAGASPMSNWLFTPTLQPTQLTLSWPQIGTVQLQQAPSPKGSWSTYAWVTTNDMTVPIVAGNQFYRLLEPTNASPQTINYVASNPANTNGF